MIFFIRTVILLGFSFLSAPLFSQLIFDVYQHTNKYSLEKLDMKKIEQEDLQLLTENSRLPVGRTHKVNIQPAQLYQHTTSADILIVNDNAKATSLYFDKFILKNNASLEVFNMDGLLLYSINNTQKNNFIIPQLPEDSLKLVFQYQNFSDINFSLNEIANIYHSNSTKIRAKKSPINSSKKCQVNVNCTEGNEYRDQKNSVVQITVYSGGIIFQCTGALVNNTAKDFKPYILTAMHCGMNNISKKLLDSSDFKKWVFYFNFESQNCTNPKQESEVPENYVTGSDVIANSNDKGGDEGSDFLLLLLNDSIPKAFKPYYAGWCIKSKDIATHGVSIHHPSGDIKKISTFDRKPILASFGGVVFAHWQINWVATDNGHGVTESGSSGAPVFNENKQIFGTLSGGLSNCNSTFEPDYFGKLSYSWDMNGKEAVHGLKDWLDPIGSHIYYFDGMYGDTNAPTNFIYKTEKPKIDFYPNPAHENIEISLPSLYDFFEIYDSKGLMIKAKTKIYETDFSISISDLPSGFYIINFIGNSGNSIKFMKQ